MTLFPVAKKNAARLLNDALRFLRRYGHYYQIPRLSTLDHFDVRRMDLDGALMRSAFGLKYVKGVYKIDLTTATYNSRAFEDAQMALVSGLKLFSQTPRGLQMGVSYPHAYTDYYAILNFSKLHPTMIDLEKVFDIAMPEAERLDAVVDETREPSSRLRFLSTASK